MFLPHPRESICWLNGAGVVKQNISVAPPPRPMSLKWNRTRISNANL